MPQAYFTFVKQIFHIEDIYSFRKERISLKKAIAEAIVFFWCGRWDLTRALRCLVARGHNSTPDCCSVPLVLQVPKTFRKNISSQTQKRLTAFCERVTKRSRIEVKVSKSSVTALFDKLEFVDYIGVPTSIKLPSKS